MKRKYFSAANTTIGFVNHFSKALNSELAKQILYIKGGSGVGKSTLMKNASQIAQNKGFDVTEIYCSSDANSLDGIVIENGKLAIFDATMPHISDPIYPRVNGKIVDLSQFIDEKKLYASSEDIKKLVKIKKDHYTLLYSLLAPLKMCEDTIFSLFEVDKNAITKVKNEIISKIKGNETHIISGFLKCIDAKGTKDITNEFAPFDETITLESDFDTFNIYLINEISKTLDISNRKTSKFYSILNPSLTETLSTDRTILSSSKALKGDIIFDINNLINIKNTSAYMVLSKFKEDTFALGSKEIEQAKSAHMQLENYYKACMDYEALSSYEERLLKDFFNAI